MQVLNAFTAAKQFRYGKNTVVPELAQVLLQLFCLKGVEFCITEVENARFQ